MDAEIALRAGALPCTDYDGLLFGEDAVRHSRGEQADSQKKEEATNQDTAAMAPARIATAPMSQGESRMCPPYGSLSSLFYCYNQKDPFFRAAEAGTPSQRGLGRAGRSRSPTIERAVRHAAVLGVLLTLCLTGVVAGAAAHGQATSGTVEGRVTFEGTPPAPTAVIEAGSSQPVLYVDRSGGLQYAVVFLSDARKEGNSPKTPATMNQRQFIFEPQVLAVRAGQPVRFTNDDPANHNVRAQDANPANTFNILTGPGAAEQPVQQFVATLPNRPLQLSCDIHPSMIAWIYVFDHAQFAVTTAGGRFRIENVPPGRHRLAVRQPAGKLERDLAVDVKAGETIQIDVRFIATDLGMPTR